ncbi:elongation factor-1 alpha [Anopheles sinensis]|uniref:Elongation factor-1 alpha n=1 Tax=Anopheles sinensis TaxID=74873 RepID=A0A084WRX0_ANOSI|nr:elongation factor-1 alpha [Anopheles sinensis]
MALAWKAVTHCTVPDTIAGLNVKWNNSRTAMLPLRRVSMDRRDNLCPATNKTDFTCRPVSVNRSGSRVAKVPSGRYGGLAGQH